MRNSSNSNRTRLLDVSLVAESSKNAPTPSLYSEEALDRNNYWVTPYEVNSADWWEDARNYSRTNPFVTRGGMHDLYRLRFALDDLRVGLKIKDVALALYVLNLLGGWNDRCYELVDGEKRRFHWTHQQIAEQWKFVDEPSYRPYPFYCMVKKVKKDRRAQEVLLTDMFIAACLQGGSDVWVSGKELYEGFKVFVPDFPWSYPAFLFALRKQGILNSTREIRGERVGFTGVSVQNIEPLYFDKVYAYRPRKQASTKGKVRKDVKMRSAIRTTRQAELRNKIMSILSEVAEPAQGIRASERFSVDCLMDRLGATYSRKLVGVILTSLGMTCDRKSRLKNWKARTSC